MFKPHKSNIFFKKNFFWKEKILKEPEEKKNLTNREAKIKIKSNLSQETTQERREQNEIFEVLRETTNLAFYTL